MGHIEIPLNPRQCEQPVQCCSTDISLYEQGLSILEKPFVNLRVLATIDMLQRVR